MGTPQRGHVRSDSFTRILIDVFPGTGMQTGACSHAQSAILLDYLLLQLSKLLHRRESNVTGQPTAAETSCRR